MTTPRRTQLQVVGIPVDVVRKDIKNLHLAVYPPKGRVRVAVPLHVDDETVKLAVMSRLDWIKRRQVQFERQDRQSPREMVSGETHYVWGRRYRLNVIEGHPQADIRVKTRNTLELRIPAGTSRRERQSILHEWYRDLLRAEISKLTAKWQERVGVEAAECRIKRMKTRWGSCSRSSKRIWLNLELAKKSPECLEYIVVHELVHLLESRHNDHFRQHLDRVLPMWRMHRETLNQAPLAFETWTY